MNQISKKSTRYIHYIITLIYIVCLYIPISSAAYSTNGLVAYYNFSNDAINGIVVDQSGNGNGLINHGTSYMYTGNGTYVRHFDGSSYLTSSNNLADYRNGFTWEIAYYPTTSINTDTTVMTAGLNWNQYNLESCYGGGYTGFYGNQGAGWVETRQLTPDYVANEWVTVFIVYNATEQRWYEYKNGTVLGNQFTQYIDAGNELLNSNLTIGRSGSGGEYFTGNVSYVRVYDRPLTVGEMDYNYMNTKNHYQALQTLNMSKSLGTLKIPINLRQQVNFTTNITYSTSDGVAKAGIDYAETSGTLTYLPGETTKYINIQVQDDGTIWQTPKPFYISLIPELNDLLVYNNLTINLINQPGILLTFDDENLQAWVDSLNQFDKYNAKATFYVAYTYDWDQPRWALCKQLQNDGMEIGAHTENHYYPPDYVSLYGIQSFIDDEILLNKQDISTNLSDPTIPTTFAYPYGNDISSDIDNAILPYFDTIRKTCNTGSPEAFYNFNDNRVLHGILITDYPMGVDNYRLHTMMDYVRDNGGVLVTFGHNITQDTDYSLRMSYARLNDICEYAQTNNLKFYRASDLVTKQPPVANFTANRTEGYAPLTVQFTDLSENATSVSWDFDNNGVIDSTASNPVYEFINAGIYTVNLTATNVNGTDSKLATINVTERTILPVADFSASITDGYAPLSVTFTDLSQNAITRNWNFGDGTTSTKKNPKHTYSVAGIYTVNLTVSNDNSTASKTAMIIAKKKSSRGKPRSSSINGGGGSGGHLNL
ncbi:MAG: PKD domain-containing protein [Methanosarcina sp.]|nr:PKD domain-containing protein [Methanosarcina sp.]